MSERNGYPPGVPCWVTGSHADPEGAVSFYTELFGWAAEDVSAPASSGQYFLCALHGREVAAVGSPPEGVPPVPMWTTHIWVESAEGAARKVTDAGGSVVSEPFDIPDTARVAVFTDPAGAIFCVWEPLDLEGAAVVNEPGAWSLSALNTNDPEGSKAFYGAVFGWTSLTMGMKGAEMFLWRVPGYVGGEPGQPVPRDVVGAMLPLRGEDVAPHWSVDFWVGDVDATAAKAAELGGGVIVAPYDDPIGRQAVIADPQGAVLGVSKVAAGG